MRYLFRGNKKKLREQTEKLAEEYGTGISFRARDFRLILARRRKEEQYAFVAEVKETEQGCVITGDIKFTGKPWTWYDYFLSVLVCILILPALCLLSTPALFPATYASPQGNAEQVPLPLFAPSKKAMKTRLSRIMNLFTEQLE